MTNDDVSELERIARLYERERLIIETTQGFRHDMKNKLAGAAGHNELMLESNQIKSDRLSIMLRAARSLPPDKYREYLQAHSELVSSLESDAESAALALEAANDATHLLRAMMTIGQPDDGEKRVLDPNTVVRQETELLGRLYREQGSKLEVIAKSRSRVRVQKTALSSAMHNLLRNALEAGEYGTRVRVQVSDCELTGPLKTALQQTAPAGKYVRIDVSNEQAIPQDVRERLFRQRVTSKEGSGGTGRGLMMTRSYISEMGGYLDYVTGEGTTFTILLPPTEEEHDETPDEAVLQSIVKGSVLVVEDERPVREFFSKSLTRAGHAVDSTDSLEGAMELFSKGHYDVVLTDLHLQGEDGRKLMRRMRAYELEHPSRKPSSLLLVTGSEPRVVDAPEADIVLGKPISSKELHRRVQEYMRI